MNVETGLLRLSLVCVLSTQIGWSASTLTALHFSLFADRRPDHSATVAGVREASDHCGSHAGSGIAEEKTLSGSNRRLTSRRRLALLPYAALTCSCSSAVRKFA
jgi:hypothetical protein